MGLKKNLLSLICSIVGIVSVIVFFAWFYNVVGMVALLEWHPNIELIPLVFKILLGAILLFLFAKLIFQKIEKPKAAKVFSIVNLCFDVLTFLTALIVMFHFISAGRRLPKNYTKLENPIYEKNISRLRKIALSSDSHWGNDISNPVERTKVIESIGNSDYDAFFCLGDVVDWGDTAGAFEEPVKELNAGLKGTPIFSIMGNHDALVDAKSIFDKIFYDNENVPLDFRMDYGDVHFIVLDILWSAKEIDKKREQWLIKQLEEIPQEETVIVLSHAYYVSSGYVDKEYGKDWFDNPYAIENICPIFEKYNVDLVISGHNHLMEILEKNGVTYAIIGTMGGKLDPLEHLSEYSVWVKNYVFGHLSLEFKSNEILMEFINSNGTVIKQYSVATN